MAHYHAGIIEIERRGAIFNIERLNVPAAVRQIPRVSRVLNPDVAYDALRNARHVERGVAVARLEVGITELNGG